MGTQKLQITLVTGKVGVRAPYCEACKGWMVFRVVSLPLLHVYGKIKEVTCYKKRRNRNFGFFGFHFHFVLLHDI